MSCPVCEGAGSVSRETWSGYSRGRYNDNFLDRALLGLQTHDKAYEVRLFTEGGHYDHGDEPAVEILHNGERIWHDWGIYLPDLILKAGAWLKDHRERARNSEEAN